MLQVADSAMANVGDSLQRLRELAVQSGDGGMSDKDRGALQQEATQILAQISDVGKSTQFNGQALFSQDTSSIGGDVRTRRVVDGLKTGWLASAEDMVKKYYGIEGDGAEINLNLKDTDGQWNTLASVSGYVESNGKVGTLSLNLDMADFGCGTHAGRRERPSCTTTARWRTRWCTPSWTALPTWPRCPSGSRKARRS